MALYDRKVLKLTWENSEKGTTKVKLASTTDVLHAMSDAWVRQAQELLAAGDKNASGKLSDSLGVKLKAKKTKLSLSMMGMPYGQYVDQGVQGAGPFTPPKNPTGKSTKPYINRAPDSPFKFGSGQGQGSIRTGIRDWLGYKRFQFRDDRGRFMSYDQMTGFISRSVYRYGLEPYPFIEKPYKETWRRYQGKLAGAFKTDIRKYFDGKEYPTNFKLKIEM